jgi:hypothetical protein
VAACAAKTEGVIKAVMTSIGGDGTERPCRSRIIEDEPPIGGAAISSFRENADQHDCDRESPERGSEELCYPFQFK